jgi:hypothetical protein
VRPATRQLHDVHVNPYGHDAPTRTPPFTMLTGRARVAQAVDGCDDLIEKRR